MLAFLLPSLPLRVPDPSQPTPLLDKQYRVLNLNHIPAERPRAAKAFLQGLWRTLRWRRGWGLILHLRALWSEMCCCGVDWAVVNRVSKRR